MTTIYAVLALIALLAASSIFVMARLTRSPVDERDIREELRLDVMELSARVGSNNVPPALLDEAMDIWRTQGMRAARRHIHSATPSRGNALTA